jgi:UDP-N-acetyl-D-glucosamine dehydrogenase
MTRRVGVIGLGTIGRQELSLLRGGDHDLVGYDNRASVTREVAATETDRTRRVTLTSDPSALETCITLILCLPTVDAHGEISLAAFDDVLDKLRGRVKDDALVIVASSVPIGFTRGFAGRLGTTLVAAAPERFDPGRGLELARIPRVVGGLTAHATDQALAHYRAFGVATRRVESPEVAEASKILENAFRLLNVAFINEFADVCRRLGLVAADVIDAAATKPFGFMAHYPGAGAGGVCVPVVPRYLLAAAADVEGSAPILTAALRANDEQPARIARTISGSLSQNGGKILVVGATYKADYSDSRGSPALRLIRELASSHTVEVLDPVLNERDIPDGVVLHREVPLGQFVAVVIAVRHKDLKLDAISALAPVVFDLGRGEVRGTKPATKRSDVPQLTRS